VAITIIEDGGRLLFPWEFARMINVSVATVTKWGKQKKIRVVMTPGGRRRYYEEDAKAILRGDWNAAFDNVQPAARDVKEEKEEEEKEGT
jgi:hypothetical protein